MCNLKACLLILVTFYSGSICHQWPKQIKRCSLSAPNLDKCVMEAAKIALPHLSKGIKEINFPQLEPFSFRNLTMKNNAPPLDVVFQIRNGTLRDTISGYSLQKMWFDKKKYELHFESIHKRLRMAGNFLLKGKVFVFDVDSAGHFEIDFRNASHYHIAKFIPSKTKKGFGDINIKYKLKSLGQFTLSLKDSSLSPPVENGIVRIVNENQDIVTELMKPTGEQGLEIIMVHAIRPLFRKFKLADIFLP